MEIGHGLESHPTDWKTGDHIQDPWVQGELFTVNSDIFVRILFSEIALKYIFAMLKTMTRA